MGQEEWCEELTSSGDLGGLAVGIVIHYDIYVMAFLVDLLRRDALMLTVDEELQYTIVRDTHAQTVACSQLVQVHLAIVLLGETVSESVVQLVRAPDAVVSALG